MRLGFLCRNHKNVFRLPNRGRPCSDLNSASPSLFSRPRYRFQPMRPPQKVAAEVGTLRAAAGMLRGEAAAMPPAVAAVAMRAQPAAVVQVVRAQPVAAVLRGTSVPHVHVPQAHAPQVHAPEVHVPQAHARIDLRLSMLPRTMPSVKRRRSKQPATPRAMQIGP